MAERELTLRYTSRCACCAAPLPFGTRGWFEPFSRVWRCTTCHDDGVPAPEDAFHAGAWPARRRSPTRAATELADAPDADAPPAARAGSSAPPAGTDDERRQQGTSDDEDDLVRTTRLPANLSRWGGRWSTT
jgi:hypothetical protein